MVSFLEMLDDDLFHPEDKEFDQQQNWLNRIQLMRPKSSYELTKTYDKKNMERRRE